MNSYRGRGITVGDIAYNQRCVSAGVVRDVSSLRIRNPLGRILRNEFLFNSVAEKPRALPRMAGTLNKPINNYRPSPSDPVSMDRFCRTSMTHDRRFRERNIYAFINARLKKKSALHADYAGDVR